MVGGGNTAVEGIVPDEFCLESNSGASPRHLRSEKILQQRLLAHDKIEVLWNSEIDEVLGTDDSAGRYRRAPAQHPDRRHA